MRGVIPACLLIFSLTVSAQAQAPPGEVRVSVVLNADGSRTTYETDAGNRKCVATTTGTNGKVREKINYDLDENGRFARGEVLGPKGEFRFNALYKYDANNHLTEETHLAKDETVIGKIVFQYDAAGHQSGYAAYDGGADFSGKPPRPVRHQQSGSNCLTGKIALESSSSACHPERSRGILKKLP